MFLTGLYTEKDTTKELLITDKDKFIKALLTTKDKNKIAFGYSVKGEKAATRLSKEAMAVNDVWWHAYGIDVDREPHDEWPDPKDAEDALEKVTSQVVILISTLRMPINRVVSYSSRQGLRIWLFFKRPQDKKATKAIITKLGAGIDLPGMEFDESSKTLTQGQRVAFGQFFHRDVVLEAEQPERAISEALINWLRNSGYGYLKHVVEGLPLGSPGGRDKAIYQAVNSLVRVLTSDGSPVPEDPESVYSTVDFLLRPCILADKTPDAPSVDVFEEKLKRAIEAYSKQLEEVDSDLPILLSLTKANTYLGKRTLDGHILYDNLPSNNVVAHMQRNFPAIDIRNTKGGFKPAQLIHIEMGGNLCFQIKHQYGVKKPIFQEGTLTPSSVWLAPADPVYDPTIQKWLLYLTSGDDILLRWLTLVHLTDRPLAAFYLRGSASAGKSFLAHKLIPSLFKTSTGAPSSISFAEAVSKFNGGLTRSPVVVIDENNDSDAKRSSVVRLLIGNTTHDIEEKFMARSRLFGAPRLVVVANNDNALNFHEELTSQDHEALVKRFIYRRAPDDACDILDKLTRDDTDSWIEKKFRNHVAWLRENTTYITDALDSNERFLLSDDSPEFASIVQLSSKRTRIVFGAILSGMFKKAGAANPYLKGEYNGSICVFVPVNDILESWNRIKWGPPPDHGEIAYRVQANSVTDYRTKSARGFLVSMSLIYRANELLCEFPDEVLAENIAKLKTTVFKA